MGRGERPPPLRLLRLLPRLLQRDEVSSLLIELAAGRSAAATRNINLLFPLRHQPFTPLFGRLGDIGTVVQAQPSTFLDGLLLPCLLRLQIIPGAEESSPPLRRHYASAGVKGPDAGLGLCGMGIH